MSALTTVDRLKSAEYRFLPKKDSMIVTVRLFIGRVEGPSQGGTLSTRSIDTDKMVVKVIVYSKDDEDDSVGRPMARQPMSRITWLTVDRYTPADMLNQKVETAANRFGSELLDARTTGGWLKKGT